MQGLYGYVHVAFHPCRPRERRRTGSDRLREREAVGEHVSASLPATKRIECDDEYYRRRGKPLWRLCGLAF
jgi:hypothetical protein